MSLLKNKYLITLTLLVLVPISACTRGPKLEGDPKQVLTDYIQTTFSVRDVQDRNKLAGYLTGGAKNRLVAWSEDQFRQAFIETKRDYIKLAIREVKPVNPNRTDITYELTYLDKSKGADTRVTTKRMCELSLENGKWLIRDVKNIKELIEYKSELSIVY